MQKGAQPTYFQEPRVVHETPFGCPFYVGAKAFLRHCPKHMDIGGKAGCGNVRGDGPVSPQREASGTNPHAG